VTAEGYVVTLSELRVAIQDIQFTIEGETHAGLLERLHRMALPQALAHPGHYAGGEVTGELRGTFLLDFFAQSDTPLGTGTLLEGEYHGANFTFRRATTADGLAANDPLLGHTAVMRGTALRDGKTFHFQAVLDIDEGTQMVGAPFTLRVQRETNVVLRLEILAVDPSTEQDSLLDGIDFAALDTDGDGNVSIQPGDAAHNIARRTLQVHDHWWVNVQQSGT